MDRVCLTSQHPLPGGGRGGFNTAPPPPRTRISWWEKGKFVRRNIDLGCFGYTTFWVPDPLSPPPLLKQNSENGPGRCSRCLRCNARWVLPRDVPYGRCAVVRECAGGTGDGSRGIWKGGWQLYGGQWRAAPVLTVPSGGAGEGGPGVHGCRQSPVGGHTPTGGGPPPWQSAPGALPLQRGRVQIGNSKGQAERREPEGTVGGAGGGGGRRTRCGRRSGRCSFRSPRERHRRT